MPFYRSFIIILFLLIIGCKPKASTNTLIGNWYSCSRSGDYIEMYVVDKKYKYITDFQLPQNWNEYRVSGDTLIQHYFDNILDTTYYSKALIHFVNESQISIDYLTFKEVWVLNKLTNPIIDINNDSLLMAGIKLRSINANCQDQRSHEEKKRDSLIFQF